MTGPAGLSLPLAFLAGLLTFLSPCVLPLLPIVLGSAGRDDQEIVRQQPIGQQIVERGKYHPARQIAGGTK